MKTNFSIQILKKLCTTCVIASVVSCGFLSDDAKTQNNMDTPVTQTANTDTYIVKPNYEHPKFKALEEAFAKQEHRFKIDRCEFKYNDKAFFIGDTMEKIISIFGEPDEGKIKSADGTETTLIYEKLNFFPTFSTSTKELESYSLRMSDYKEHKDTPYNIIKFRKVPYQLKTTLNEFTELCDLRHDKTLGHTSASFYVINEKKCTKNDILKIETSIGSKPSFETTVIGGGHMTITERGNFRPEVTEAINSISVYIKK